MNVNKLIKEESIKILSETEVLEDNKLKFRQVISDSAFYNYDTFSNDYDIVINRSSIIINWHVGFWVNQFGIENFVVMGDSVEGLYRIEFHDKQTDEIVQETDKNISEINWKFNVDSAILQLGKTLYIERLDFDFKSNICNITFFNSGE